MGQRHCQSTCNGRRKTPKHCLLLIYGTAPSIACSFSIALKTLLPHVAREDEDGPGFDRRIRAWLHRRRKSAGHQSGLEHEARVVWPARGGRFLGEGTLPTRLAFLSVAVWWLVFSIPLFRRVREPAAAGDGERVRSR